MYALAKCLLGVNESLVYHFLFSAIAICAANCHPIGGSCSVPGQCSCNSGWTGTNCDQCVPSLGCCMYIKISSITNCYFCFLMIAQLIIYSGHLAAHENHFFPFVSYSFCWRLLYYSWTVSLSLWLSRSELRSWYAG